MNSEASSASRTRQNNKKKSEMENTCVTRCQKITHISKTIKSWLKDKFRYEIYDKFRSRIGRFEKKLTVMVF